MAELADAADSKSAEGNLVGVRPPLPAPEDKLFNQGGLASVFSSPNRLVPAPRQLYLTPFGTVSVQALYWRAMATLVKTDSGTWKAVIRKVAWPTTAKTFRTKRDAEDWSRRTEDEMVRGACIQRAMADRMTVEVALKRYLAEVVPTKRARSQLADVKRSRILIKHLSKYSLAALNQGLIAKIRDMRVAGEDRLSAAGKPPIKGEQHSTS